MTSDSETTMTMMTTVVSMKEVVVRACGSSRPVFVPTATATCSSQWVYGSKAWLDNYVRGSSIVEIFERLRLAIKSDRSGADCAADASCVHALRLFGFFLRTTWMGETERSPPNGVAYQNARLLTWRIANGGDRRLSKKMRAIEDQLTAMVAGRRNRYRSLDNIYRNRFVTSYYTGRKSAIAKAVSDLVTERWRTAASDVYREIAPDVNYVRRLAVTELLVHRLTDATAEQLYVVNEILRRACLAHPDLNSCADAIYVMNMAQTMGSARSRVKLLEVNRPRDCRCFAKCIGPVGLDRKLEMRLWDAFERHAGTIVCGACRQSPVINTAGSEKVRRTYSSVTPEVESCSVDGCSSFKFVRLVIQDVRCRRGGRLDFRCSHRFFATNTVSVTDELDGRPKRGVRARFYGVCYDGKRTCTRRFTVASSSGRSEAAVASFADTDAWFRCDDCRSFREGGAASSLALCSSQSEDPTCLRRYFSASTLVTDPRQLCRGCKMAATCYHVDLELFRFVLRADDATLSRLFARIEKLARLRLYLTKPECWSI